MTLALCIDAKKLHSILLGILSNNSNKSTIKGHLAQARFIWTDDEWAIELSEYGIQYKPWFSLKEQFS